MTNTPSAEKFCVMCACSSNAASGYTGGLADINFVCASCWMKAFRPPLQPSVREPEPSVAMGNAQLKAHADVLAYDVEILLSYLSVEDKKLWGVMKIQQELDAYMKFREVKR